MLLLPLADYRAGGGISGLASAYYLTKELPHSRVVLFEASEGLGGWIKSRTVDVGNGSVVFEQGPRTLRTALPNGPVTISLVYSTVLSG